MMEIGRTFGWMAERPVGFGAVAFLDDGGEIEQPREVHPIWRQDHTSREFESVRPGSGMHSGEIDIRVSHAFPIIVERVSRPFRGRAEIKLKIAGAVGRPDKGLEAGMLPQPVCPPLFGSLGEWFDALGKSDHARITRNSVSDAKNLSIAPDPDPRCWDPGGRAGVIQKLHWLRHQQLRSGLCGGA